MSNQTPLSIGDEIREAAERIYRRYGNDLAAFERDYRAALGQKVQTPPCGNGHIWSNQFGDDWTPDVGTSCDCGQKKWGVPLPQTPPSQGWEWQIEQLHAAAKSVQSFGNSVQFVCHERQEGRSTQGDAWLQEVGRKIIAEAGTMLAVIRTVTEAHAASDRQIADLTKDVGDVEAAREIIRRDADFQEWAQSYLDAGRWAGHDRSDAIRQELLERDEAAVAWHLAVETICTVLGLSPALSAEESAAAVRDRVDSLTAENTALRDNNTAVKALFDEKASEVTALTAQVEDLEERVRSQDEAFRDSLAKAKEIHAAELSELRGSVERLTQEKEELEEQKGDLEMHKASRDSQLACLLREIGGYEYPSMNDARDQIAAWKRDSAELQQLRHAHGRLKEAVMVAVSDPHAEWAKTRGDLTAALNVALRQQLTEQAPK